MVATLVFLALQVQTPVFEYPFVVNDSAMFVDAKVNGADVRLMFDTGFSGAAIINDGIEIGKADGTMVLRDFVGNINAKTVTIKSLKLGAKEFVKQGMSVVQQPTRSMSASYNMHVDGILGLEPFNDYVTEINFERHCFRFFPKGADLTKRPKDGVKTFLTELLPTGKSSLEMSVGVGTGGKLIMALDTGNAFYATTHRDSLERVGLWPTSKKPKYLKTSGIASGSVDTWMLEMPTANIFGIQVQQSVWDVIDLPSSAAESDGTVGYQFLKNFNIAFDTGARKVWFENFSGKLTEEPKGEIGIVAAFTPKQGKVVVLEVSPESPAARAGLKEKDEILSVNGRDLNRENYVQVRKLTEGTPGSSVKLVVSRNGELMRLDLKREVLVNSVSTQ